MISGGSHLKYGKVLYRVAAKKGVEDRVFADLEELAEMYLDSSFSDLIKKLTLMEKSKLMQLLKSVFQEKIHSLTLNALMLLASSRKIGLLPRVAEAYRQIYNEEKNIREFRVSSARKLSRDEELRLTEKLREKTHKEVSVRFEENPQLIGGLQIFERGYMTDYSLRNYLYSLKRHLMKSELS